MPVGCPWVSGTSCREPPLKITSVFLIRKRQPSPAVVLYWNRPKCISCCPWKRLLPPCLNIGNHLKYYLVNSGTYHSRKNHLCHVPTRYLHFINFPLYLWLGIFHWISLSDESDNWSSLFSSSDWLPPPPLSGVCRTYVPLCKVSSDLGIRRGRQNNKLFHCDH